MGQEERQAAAAHADAQRAQRALSATCLLPMAATAAAAVAAAAAAAAAWQESLQPKQGSRHSGSSLQILLSQTVWLRNDVVLPRAAAAAAAAIGPMASRGLWGRHCDAHHRLAGHIVEAKHPPLLPAGAAAASATVGAVAGLVASRGGLAHCWVCRHSDPAVAVGAVLGKDEGASVAPPAAALGAVPPAPKGAMVGCA